MGFTSIEFNDTNSGLVQDINFILGTDNTRYPLADKTRNINLWYKRVTSWIWDAVGDWEYDDSNYSTLPEATTTMVNGQKDYTLPTNAQKIERVEVKDINGNFILLKPFDKSQITDLAMSELLKTDGMPIYYDLIGRSLLLYPSPGTGYVTMAAGLKIYVSRDITEFNSTATDTTPGFATEFHRLLSYGASLDFADAYGWNNKTVYLKTTIEDMKAEMIKFYAVRHKEDFGLKIMPQDERYI